jgi:NAD(P)H-hydrate repair Nnr-like enzyme with NAD(P)H-hydrate dehydratase domain
MVDEAAIADVTLALLTKVSGPTFILDAEAFVQMREHCDVLRAHKVSVVATPHSGEMAKFLNVSRDEIERKPGAFALKASEMTGAVIALKGAMTHIANPAGKSWICDHGCIGLGTSGSGDTLAGILTGLVARGAAPETAAYWSTYLHAEAGQRLTRKLGAVGFLAREIPAELPRIMEDLKNG